MKITITTILILTIALTIKTQGNIQKDIFLVLPCDNLSNQISENEELKEMINIFNSSFNDRGFPVLDYFKATSEGKTIEEIKNEADIIVLLSYVEKEDSLYMKVEAQDYYWKEIIGIAQAQKFVDQKEEILEIQKEMIYDCLNVLNAEIMEYYESWFQIGLDFKIIIEDNQETEISLESSINGLSIKDSFNDYISKTCTKGFTNILDQSSSRIEFKVKMPLFKELRNGKTVSNGSEVYFNEMKKYYKNSPYKAKLNMISNSKRELYISL